MSNPARILALGTALVFAAACNELAAPDKIPSIEVRAARQRADYERLLASMRQATAKYHNIQVARADGYVDDGFGCISDPTLGAMGWPLIRDDLHADPSIDPLAPELLIYLPEKNGEMRLIAVEYEVYQSDWWNAGNREAPEMLGKVFDAIEFPGLDPVFGLHVWLWTPNPSGMLAEFNPTLACP